MQRHSNIDITDRVERFVERERHYCVALEVDALVAKLEAERDTLKAAIGDLLAFADAERETFRVAQDRDQYQFYSGYREALARVATLAACVPSQETEK